MTVDNGILKNYRAKNKPELRAINKQTIFE